MQKVTSFRSPLFLPPYSHTNYPPRNVQRNSIADWVQSTRTSELSLSSGRSKRSCGSVKESARFGEKLANTPEDEIILASSEGPSERSKTLVELHNDHGQNVLTIQINQKASVSSYAFTRAVSACLAVAGTRNIATHFSLLNNAYSCLLQIYEPFGFSTV